MYDVYDDIFSSILDLTTVCLPSFLTISLFIFLISVIFCEAVAIYGVIVAIILQTKLESVPAAKLYAPESLRAGYAIFASGIIVGFANLVCGYVLSLFIFYQNISKEILEILVSSVSPCDLSSSRSLWMDHVKNYFVSASPFIPSWAVVFIWPICGEDEEMNGWGHHMRGLSCSLAPHMSHKKDVK